MTKKIAFRRPSSATTSPDAWVAAGAETEGRTAIAGLVEEEVMKRLTIDLPLGLHRRVKRGCADRGVKMADVVRDLLAAEFPD